MTRVWRLLAVLVLATITLLVPTSASALGPDCKDSPAPETPGTGIGGWFTDAPKTMPTGESWQNGAPVFEHYGYAGYRWNTYDLGCGADLARNPDAVIGTAMANWLYQLPKIAVGLTNFVVHYAFHPTFLSVFDPLVTQAMNALKSALFDQWALLFVALAGVLLLWKIKTMRLSQGMTMVGWALLVFVIASAVFQWPLRAGQVTDQVVTTVLGSINHGINGTGPSKDPADEVAQNLTGAVLFEQWKTGEFGDANGAIAAKYARPMWESQTLTWADAKLVADDPDGAGRRLLDFKAKQYEDTAAQIKDEDPSAYEYLIGKRGDDRFGAAFMATFAAAVACPFLLMACVLILAAFLLVRLAVIFFPVVATVGVSYQFRGVVKGLLNAVAAAVVNCIVFGAGASVTIMTIGILLSPSNQLPEALRLILVALVTFIMWVVLKPFRKLTSMVGANHNLFGSAATSLSDTGKSVTKQVVGLGKAVIGSYIGNMAADKTQEKREEKKREKGEKVSEETTIIEPDVPETTTTESPEIHEPVELPGRQPVAAIGTRPAHTEPAPHERPGARVAQPVDGTPVNPSVATRPSHNEVGPYEASTTGLAVAPVEGMVTGFGSNNRPDVVRPEYAGGSVIPERPQSGTRNQPDDGVWMPSDNQPQRPDESAGIVDLRDSAPVVDETGAPVWPVWTPSEGITFDQRDQQDAPEAGERS